MEKLFSQFDSIILLSKTKVYDIPGDRHTERAELTFFNQSRLIAYQSHFYDTDRKKYSYQWMTDSHQLIMRWDNAHDVPGIDTSPHHQHIGSEENVQPSEPMTLEKVLAFIADQLKQQPTTSD